MDAFREAYGFVASDDVLRAVSVMVLNTMRETGSPDDFLGHLGSTEFLLVISPSGLNVLPERLRSRLEQALDYFYPIKDRDQIAGHKDRLTIKTSVLDPAVQSIVDVDALKTELGRLKK
jgi:GGDEF domain-containing protein